MIGLDATYKVINCGIGVAVVRIFYFRPSAEQSICLINEKDGSRTLGFIKDMGEILFGFADVFAHHG